MAKHAKGKGVSGKRRTPEQTKHNRAVNIVHLRELAKDLRAINSELRYKNCFEDEHFTSGLIAFRPRKKSDPKQINHEHKDVICHVIKGRGRLRIRNRRIQLTPGTICHIPKKTPHDFAAGKSGELVLFYSLIKTG